MVSRPMMHFRTSTREGIRLHYWKDANRSRDRAQEVIRIYRHHNKLSRKGAPVPSFFDIEPDFPQGSTDDFPLQAPNNT